MDTGKLNNTIFYDGYEGEGEIVLTLLDSQNAVTIHVWDGYFEEIFGTPTPSDAGWTGFTRDYQESVRTFNGEERILLSSIPEYLSDLRNYENHTFSYDETNACLNLLIDFFNQALSSSSEITVEIL